MRFSREHLVPAVLLLVASAVLLLVYPDSEFLWFRGQPLGVVLGILGLLEALQTLRGRGSRADGE